MNKKGDFDFEWLPGFREMMACQNEEQNTQQETDLGNEKRLSARVTPLCRCTRTTTPMSTPMGDLAARGAPWEPLAMGC